MAKEGIAGIGKTIQSLPETAFQSKRQYYLAQWLGELAQEFPEAFEEKDSDIVKSQFALDLLGVIVPIGQVLLEAERKNKTREGSDGEKKV